ncbi:hypothetical protein SLS60_003316 [Paraconiothyrium brasiliense]|uniref:chitinase n=1 Tax=Paraconiothyrium brasiliense TaxID=300254 RepID=A0ABR3RVC0_9PLEO
MAFMRSEIFNDPDRDDWPHFMTVEEARTKFPKETKIMVAIGGWGNEDGFREAARTQKGRRVWAEGVRKMVESTGADGVDIDWEYPGGNGEDYKRTPNSAHTWEITAYPLLLSALRIALGPSKLISAAVPGLSRDMLAFTPSTMPFISPSVDFLNIMTYDLMNRRDNVTKHHTGFKSSLEAIDAYIAAGLEPSKANLGLAFYVKWFKTDPAARQKCKTHPIGCPAALMENPTTGADLGKAGAFSWHDDVPTELKASFSKALKGGLYDKDGYFYFDAEEDLFWSFDTPDAIRRKVSQIRKKRGIGGIFAWGLGEDAPELKNLKAANKAVQLWRDGRVDRSEL